MDYKSNYFRVSSLVRRSFNSVDASSYLSPLLGAWCLELVDACHSLASKGELNLEHVQSMFLSTTSKCDEQYHNGFYLSYHTDRQTYGS